MPRRLAMPQRKKSIGITRLLPVVTRCLMLYIERKTI